MKKLRLFILLVNFIFFFSFTSNFFAQVKNDSLHVVHWSYTGETGPAHWSELNPADSLCGCGHEQSPVDISNTFKSKLDKIKFNYKPSEINLVNNGHTIQLIYTKGSSAIINGKKFNLIQFHFHIPSEHTINGMHYNMELHLVHQDEKGEIAVIGVFFKIGSFNKTLQILIDNLPKEINLPIVNQKLEINAYDFIPKNQIYYHYFGSLTTPPCTEKINWNIFKSPIQASVKQINQLKSLMGENSRPVQKLNDRFLLESE